MYEAFSEDDQKLLAQNAMDYIIEFFKWDTYTEEELFEMDIVGGGDGFDLLAEGECIPFIKENFTPSNFLNEMSVGVKGDAHSCPIANTIKHGFPNFHNMNIEVTPERILIEDLLTYDNVIIPCQDTPVDFFVGAFDGGHLPMYEYKEEWED